MPRKIRYHWDALVAALQCFQQNSYWEQMWCLVEGLSLQSLREWVNRSLVNKLGHAALTGLPFRAVVTDRHARVSIGVRVREELRHGWVLAQQSEGGQKCEHGKKEAEADERDAQLPRMAYDRRTFIVIESR
jgi:hypothetical protein